ncbi:unnamed protein product, partial [Didymodactylos carnosus]
MHNPRGLPSKSLG